MSCTSDVNSPSAVQYSSPQLCLSKYNSLMDTGARKYSLMITGACRSIYGSMDTGARENNLMTTSAHENSLMIIVVLVKVVR